MRRVELPYTPHNQESIFQTPRRHDCFLSSGAEWLTGDTEVRVGDIPVLLRADAGTADLVLLEALYHQALEYPFVDRIKRLSGPSYHGEIFGMTELQGPRKRFGASASMFDLNHPEMSRILWELVSRGWERLREMSPEMHAAIDSAPKARDEWRMHDTPYTSGVINASASVPYHRDRGNVPHTGSIMWVSRKLVGGGHLHIPELDAVVDCSHGTLLVFYGEILWHGVTLMHGLSRDRAERYSVVAYARNRILNAKSPDEEHYAAALRGTRLADVRRDTVLAQTERRRRPNGV